MLFYSPFPFQSVDCFCSSRRLIASLLASFALVRRRNCSCSYSRQFRFSLSIVYALLLALSVSVRRLFLLFSSINSFSSRQFRCSPRLLLLFYLPVPLQSVALLVISSLLTSFTLVRRLLLIFSLMDLGGVRRKMKKNGKRLQF